MSKSPPSPHQSHLKAVGKVLLTRRISLDPARHRTRDGWVETVIAVTGMDRPKRTIIDLETGVRDGYSTATLTMMERAYRLSPGTLDQALKGGELIADDGEVLYPPPASEESPQEWRERHATERRRDEITGRVISMVRSLEEAAEELPEDVAQEALHRALDAAEDQARLVTEAYRRGHELPQRGKRNSVSKKSET